VTGFINKSHPTMRLIGKFVLVLIILLILGVGFLFHVIRGLPNADEITQRKIVESTKIYDRTGEVLLYEIHGEEKRTIIPEEEIPDFVKYATISIEDNAFYSHPAFDWRGILRALMVDLLRGGAVQGGSTITQQLAKTAFLTPERTITRKIKELVLAWRLEQHYSKDEILNLYLNQVPYGANSYGIEAAAQTYFNKRAKDLNLSEVALLVSLPNSPSYYSPWGSHTSELEERRKFVLKRMRELGYIDEEQLASSIDNSPKVVLQPASSIKAPHFVFYVQDYLRKKYGDDLLEIGGLKITTTLDWELQKLAEEAVENGVKRNSELYRGENGALVAQEPTTGQVLAMVGSKDYFAKSVPEGCAPGKNCKFEGNFNVAAQGLRQPGSALKPFIYLTAFQKGFAPETILWDTATEFNTGNSNCPPVVDFRNTNKSCYHPENFDSVFRGPVAMKEALAQSINVPAVKTLYLAGLDNVLNNLSSFGITALNDKNRFGLSLVLGGGEVKLIELVGAYSVLADDGIKHNQAVVLKVENNKGNVLEEYKDENSRVADENHARLINDILSDVDLRAPLYSASLKLTQVTGHQVALKTGTTNDYRDAWAIGYTPNLVAGVWVGNNNRESLTSKGGSILAAVPMWHDFMSKALLNKPLDTFPRPEPILSSNPIIRGELIEGEYHNILYYLGRVNDPQFNNWEEGIRQWTQNNQIDLNKFNTTNIKPIPDQEASISSGGDIIINLINPKNGEFVEDEITINAEIASSSKINKLEIYLNNELIENIISDLNTFYSYKSVLKPLNINIQNILVIRATNEGGSKTSKEVILFRN